MVAIVSVSKAHESGSRRWYSALETVLSKCNDKTTPEMSSDHLLQLSSVGVRDVYCQGNCRGQSAEEYSSTTTLVFPYRGTYVRHLGGNQAVAEANQILFFNVGEGYRISHPIVGGDASLSLTIHPSLLLEMAPVSLLHGRAKGTFRCQRLRIDARTQALVAMLRHSLRQKIAEPLEAESLALTLVQRALGPRTSRAAAGSAGRRHLVDRIKLLLAGDLTRRWTLGDIAAEVPWSPIYLTQVFQEVEGMPLYRYQLHLRLARSLDLLDRYDDLTALALEVGFSSHSHFSAAFRRAYGRSPSEFKRFALGRIR